MALGVGSLVLIPFDSGDIPSGAGGPSACAQPPHFGKVAAVNAGPVYDVLWDNGTLSSDIAEVFDDLYAVAASTFTRLSGQVVRFSLSSEQNSVEYDAVVIALYRRGSTTATELAMVKTISSGIYRELPCSTLNVIPGR